MPDETDALPVALGAIQLGARMDLSAASELLGTMRDASGDVVLDASAVEVLTTPALQVLVAAGDALRRDGGSLRLADPSPETMRCLGELGTGLDRIERGILAEGAV